MAAEVSSLIRLVDGGDVKESGGGGKSTALITKDLLGGCCTLESKELDLDLQVPSGWEKRLDLKSGKVYIQKCNSLNSSSSTSENKQQNKKSAAKFQDLNFPPAPNEPLKLFDDACLDLKLLPLSTSASSSPNYQSVCTLDKVKSALERAEKETNYRKRSISMSKSSSSSSSSSPPSNSSSSVKDSDVKDSDIDRVEKLSGSLAAGCPSCLIYVLISKSDPKCPRCNGIVPPPEVVKKPRIDLNISI